MFHGSCERQALESPAIRRFRVSKRPLDQTTLSITEIALAAGFASLQWFTSAFHQTYDRSPRELRGKPYDGAPSQYGNDVLLKLAYRPPYDWIQIRDFLSVRALPGVERVDERGYARTVAAGEGHAIMRVRPIDGEDALELHVRGGAPSTLLQVSSAARRMFDLAADPARIAMALRSDPLLGPLVKRRPGLRIPGAWDPFECAVRAILGQQVRVAAGRTLAARLVARIGRPIDGEDGLTHMFPTPADLATADLNGLGLTRMRIVALRTLARAVADGELAFDAPTEDIYASLIALAGIGAWTMQYVALRALVEPDAFPASDLVLRRMAAMGGRPLATSVLQARAEAWRPWRGYAAIHLWCNATDDARMRTSA